MHAKTKWPAIKIITVLAMTVAILLLAGRSLYRILHEKKQKFYTIGILYNSLNLTPEDMNVVRIMVDKRVKEINETGGFAGRNLKVRYLDDGGNRKKVYKVVKGTVNDPSLIAYIGCWSSSRVEAVADMVGKAGVPFLGGYSVTAIADKYPNMFSYEIGIEQNAFVLHNLLKHRAKKVTFIANANDIYSKALLKELKKLQRKKRTYDIVFEVWYPNEHVFTADELNHIADSVKATGTDFFVFSTNPVHTNTILQSLAEKQVQIKAFTAFIDIPEIDPHITGFRELELFDISVFGIPSVLNIRQQVYQLNNDLKLSHDKKSEFRLGLGGLHADAIGLLKQAAEFPEQSAKSTIRQQITQGLQHYINGEQVYHGWFSDWYFRENRALNSEALLGWKPVGSTDLVLAPTQFLRTDSLLEASQVIFTSVDLEAISQVNDDEGTFHAQFYLNLSTNASFSLSHIDFRNAVRNENNFQPTLDIKLLSTDSAGSQIMKYNYLYRVSGKFYFSPDLRKYPFDEQKFPISLQTNSAYKPFLIQPASGQYRDTVFDASGWVYKSNYIGFDHDLIGYNNKLIKAQRHIPFYKFEFTYVLKRAKADFLLKTLIPLLAILIITYFSVYIPIREFEALSAIQVTALLSSIALYFSAYKSQGQFATISDKIFIFTYIMVTTLIGASILQYWLYSQRAKRRELAVIVSIYERILFPLIVIVFTYFFIL